MNSNKFNLIKRKLDKKYLVDTIGSIGKKYAARRASSTNIQDLKNSFESFIKIQKLTGKLFWGYGIHRIHDGIHADHTNSLNGLGFFLSLFKEQRGKLRFVFIKIEFSTCITSEFFDAKTIDIADLEKVEKKTSSGNYPYLVFHSHVLSSPIMLQIDEEDHIDYYIKYLSDKISARNPSTLPHVKDIQEKRKDLRELLPKIKDGDQNSFLDEAMKCLEFGAYRASIIMTWNLTIDHLYNYVLDKKLSEFNAYLNTLGNSIHISNKDHFSKLKESEFIVACKKSDTISQDVRKILDNKLGIRNSCAHPSTVIIKHTKAVDFIDDLVTNVLLKYEL